jgi:hypothetical protein
MADIVERLVPSRYGFDYPWGQVCKEAADEIVRLRGTRAALRSDIANLHTLIKRLQDALIDAGMKATTWEASARDAETEWKADATCWRYVRDNLVEPFDLRMDGTSIFRLRLPRGRGRTIDEVIRNLIADQQE